MKGLKKAAALALTAVLVTGVSACGKEEQPENQKPEQPQVENEVQTEEEETGEGAVSEDEVFRYEEVEGGVSITGYNGDAAVLNIPEKIQTFDVVAISDKAFDWEDDIVEVNIPDSVKQIGNKAFSGCENMKTLNLGNGVEVIGDGAFEFCGALKEVVLPASLKIVERGAFGLGSNLEKVEMKGPVERIDNVTFSGAKFQTFTVPDGVKSIGGDAFAGCPELKELYIPASVTEIEGNIVRESPNAIICGEAGSYAETFANEMSLPFQAK